MEEKTTLRSDESMVRQILAGKQELFAVIIKDTEKLVAQIVFKFVDHPEDSKDLAQEIYLKAFRQLQKFRFESKLSTWIAKIAYNACVDHIKKKKVRVLPFITDSDGDEIDLSMEALRDRGSIEAAFGKAELQRILDEEIARLPPIYKTVLVLFHQEAFSYQELAEVTNLPEGTIKSHLFRARKQLKAQLLKKYKKEDLWNDDI